jgi:hypothetical protein
MSQAEEASPPLPPSKIPPLLQAALVCDVAVTDPSTGKPSLIGIFDRISLGRFPGARPMSVYFRVTDAEGRYPMRVDFVRAESDTLIARVEGEMNAENRTQSLGVHYDFPPLPLEQPGRYEFRIYASDMYLGSAAVEARQRSR